MSAARRWEVRAELSTIITMLILSSPAFAYDPPGPGEPDVLMDIIFVIDGSSSINSSTWELEKQGIINCFIGLDAFVPHNGTVAIGAIQFDNDVYEEVPLTIIDSPDTADTLEAGINAITQRSGGTEIAEGLEKAIEYLRYQSHALERVVVLSTDETTDNSGAITVGEQIRTGEDGQGTFPYAKICTVLVETTCTQSQFLRQLANSEDTGPFYADEPVGNFSCAPTAGDFVMLCGSCSCILLHAGERDCDDDGVPDICELDPPPSAPIIYVDQDPNVPGPRDGTSWNKAFAELVDALNYIGDEPAPNCYEIWVAEGTYLPDWEYVNEWTHTGNRALSFWLIDNVGIYGGFDGYDSPVYQDGETARNQRLPASNPTVLSGDLNGDDETVGNSDNSYHVVTAEDVSEFAVLDGFIIARGNADGWAV